MVGPVQVVMLLAIGFVAGFVVTSTCMWELLLPKLEAQAAAEGRAEGFSDGYRAAEAEFGLMIEAARGRVVRS